MEESLSAMIRPYCLRALRMPWLVAEKPELSKLAFRWYARGVGGGPGERALLEILEIPTVAEPAFQVPSVLTLEP
jgi:hypothetical protein